MIFRKILEQKKTYIHHKDLMIGSLKVLAYRLGLEQDAIEPGKYEITHDEIKYKFSGYKSYSKAKYLYVDMEVIKNKFIDIEISQNIETTLLSTEIANIFLRNGKKAKNAYDGFEKFILVVRDIMKDIPRYSIHPIVHINRIKIGPYELYWFQGDNDWELSVGFGRSLCKSNDINEIIKVVTEDLNQRAQVIESEIETVYHPNAKKLMRPALEYFSKMVDSDIVALPTKFRKTYNGLTATPDEYVVYEGMMVGYYDNDSAEILSIRAMVETPENPIEFGRYKNIGFDYNDRTVSVPKLANIMKKTALALKKENDDLLRIMKELENDYKFISTMLGIEAKKNSRRVAKIYVTQTYGKYMVDFNGEIDDENLTCDEVINLLQMHAQYEEF